MACKELEKQNPAKNIAHSINGYAVRFLKYNSSPFPSFQAEAPATPDRIADLGIVDTSWDDRLTEVCSYLLFVFIFFVLLKCMPRGFTTFAAHKSIIVH